MSWTRQLLSHEQMMNLSPAEIEVKEAYENLLRMYFGHDANGIQMDLTLETTPPQDVNVQVRVLRDHGEVLLSIGKVNLANGSVHLLPRDEAEPLLTRGVLEVLEAEVYV